MRVLSKLDDDHDEYGDDIKIGNTTQITPSHTVTRIYAHATYTHSTEPALQAIPPATLL